MKSEIDNFESSVSRLRTIKADLLKNEKVGAKAAFDHDMSRLETEWQRVNEVARGSLDTLWAEHSSWIDEMLQKMESIVSKGKTVLEARLSFVSMYPLKELMTCDAKKLLDEVQEILTTKEVRTIVHVSVYGYIYLQKQPTCTLYLYMYVVRAVL